MTGNPESTDWRLVRSALSELRNDNFSEHQLRLSFASSSSGGESVPLHQLPKLFLKMGEPFAKEIDAAIGLWQTGQPIALPSGEHEAHFYCRVSAAYQFARLHTTLEPIANTSVLQNPACSLQNAVAYLLTTWWYEHGHSEYFHSSLAGQKSMEL